MRLRVTGCRDCLRKSILIDELKAKITRLQEENARLRAAAGTSHRQVDEPPFGSSTPSAKELFKPTAPADRQAKRGGAVPGHPGHGRRPAGAGAVEEVAMAPPACCPDCGGPLETCEQRSRLAVDAEPLRVTWRKYRYPHRRCPRCKRFQPLVIPGILPKAMLTNRLLATLAGEHYLHGIPMGQLARRIGLGEGTLFNAMHQLARRLAGVPAHLAESFRQAPRKQADETPWRTDGANGYSWFFGNADTSIFRFAGSRAGSIVTEVMGSLPLPGALVVDRYAGYNVSPCPRQFCYAHLLRDLLDLEKQFPTDREVAAFVQTLAPLLADAMHLHPKPLADIEYYRQANAIKDKILAAVHHPAHHLAIQAYQAIFRQHHDKLYQWVDDRRLPPDNNFAERAIRPIVIARKISFGSQSAAGARTREILMTTLHTLAKRVPNPVDAITQALDSLVIDPDANLAKLLFPIPPVSDS